MSVTTKSNGMPTTWTSNPSIIGCGKYGLLWSRFHYTSHPGSGVVEHINLFATRAERDAYKQTVHARARGYAKDCVIQPFELKRGIPNDTTHHQRDCAQSC